MTALQSQTRAMRHTTASLTLGSLMFIVGGVVGWSFSKSVGAPYGHFTGAPIPWEIGSGVLAGIVAGVCWRNALSARSGRPPTRS